METLAEAISRDFESASLAPRQLAMLRYVKKLTRTPSEMQKADVESLRSAGFRDEDILAIAEVAGYYAYVNRLADGLGVLVE